MGLVDHRLLNAGVGESSSKFYAVFIFYYHEVETNVLGRRTKVKWIDCGVTEAPEMVKNECASELHWDAFLAIFNSASCWFRRLRLSFSRMEFCFSSFQFAWSRAMKRSALLFTSGLGQNTDAPSLDSLCRNLTVSPLRGEDGGEGYFEWLDFSGRLEDEGRGGGGGGGGGGCKTCFLWCCVSAGGSGGGGGGGEVAGTEWILSFLPPGFLREKSWLKNAEGSGGGGGGGGGAEEATASYCRVVSSGDLFVLLPLIFF